MEIFRSHNMKMEISQIYNLEGSSRNTLEVEYFMYLYILWKPKENDKTLLVGGVTCKYESRWGP